jgi:hypothetical protein
MIPDYAIVCIMTSRGHAYPKIKVTCMKKLAIGLILVLAIVLMASTPAMAKKVVIPADLHRLRVDTTIATGAYEETNFVVRATQINESGNAAGVFKFTITNTASGRKYVERGIITAMRVVDNVVVVGGIVLTSTDGSNIGAALLMGFQNNPDEATPGLHYAVSSREQILNLVNTIADEDLFVVTTALLPVESGYVVLQPKF